jgi:opacity protein-like surface antigen
MFKRVLALAALGALALGARPDAAAAQGFSVTPFVGYYAPLSNVIDEDGLELGSQTALTFGGRLGMQTTGPWGFEAALAYTTSGVESGGAEVDGNLMLMSVRALRTIGSLGPSGSLHLGAGLAYVMRGGDAWDALDDGGVEGINDFGGTLGLGARFSLSPMLNLRVDLEDYIYSAKFNDSSTETEGKLQNDLLLSVGLNFGF